MPEQQPQFLEPWELWDRPEILQDEGQIDLKRTRLVVFFGKPVQKELRFTFEDSGTETDSMLSNRIDRFVGLLDESRYTNVTDPEKRTWAKIGLVCVFTDLVDRGWADPAISELKELTDVNERAQLKKAAEERLKENPALPNSVVYNRYFSVVKRIFNLPVLESNS